MIYIKKYIFILLFIPLTKSYCQNNDYYIDNEIFYKHFEYLINSKKIDVLHPLSQPYSVRQLKQISSRKKNIVECYSKKIVLNEIKKHNKKSKLIFPYHLKLSMENQEDICFNKKVKLGTGYTFKNITSEFDLEFNTIHKFDSLRFLSVGKLGNQILYTPKKAYMKFSKNNLELFFGRISRNFGYINEYSLINSNYSYPADHFLVNFYNKKLNFSFISTRLNDTFSYDSRDSTLNYNWNKRYFSLHRIEYNLNKKLIIALTESVLYGGNNQNLLPMYLNPVNFYFLSKLNDDFVFEEKEANIMGAIDLFYNPNSKYSFYFQFLIDDIDFQSTLREQFPDRTGLTGIINLTDFFSNSQVSLKYKNISKQTYLSFYTFGNHTNFGRSLGYPKNGIEEFEISLDLFNISKLWLNIKYKHIKEISQNFNMNYEPYVSYLNGIDQISDSFSFTINFMPSKMIYTSILLELIDYKNYNFISNQRKNDFNLLININLNDII